MNTNMTGFRFFLNYVFVLWTKVASAEGYHFGTNSIYTCTYHTFENQAPRDILDIDVQQLNLLSIVSMSQC